MLNMREDRPEVAAKVEEAEVVADLEVVVVVDALMVHREVVVETEEVVIMVAETATEDLVCRTLRSLDMALPETPNTA
jgi:hypothetical protein